MRVCMVTTSFPRWTGDGQGSFIWEAARAVARKGIQVRVIAMHSPGARTHEFMDGIEVIRPRYWWPERWEILRNEGGGLPITLRKYRLARLQLFLFGFVQAATIARFAPTSDVIHAHWTLSAAAALLGRWIHHVPILVTLQGSDIFQAASFPKGAAITKSILLRCDCITALSCALAEAARAIGVSRPIHIIPNGVDTAQFVPDPMVEREDIILYVGSFIERKGVKYLLDAVADVFPTLPSYRLVLIGEGPQYFYLKRLTEQLGIAERVVFLGFQPQDQVRSWMQRAKVLVLPSLEEGQGVVLLEALACGTPVVASQVGGISQVVTEEVGILVPPANSMLLAKAIYNILSAPNYWAELSSNARERVVRHYDWGFIADLYIEIYKTLTGYASITL